MRGIERHLCEGERVVVDTRLHPRVVVAPAALFLAVCGLAAAIVSAVQGADYADHVLRAALVASVVTAVRLLWRLLAWRRTQVVVTTFRLLETSGVVRRRLSSTPLENITDISSRRTLVGKLLGYGELLVGLPGGVRRMGPLPRPHRLVQAILATLSLARRPSARPAAHASDDPPGAAWPSPGAAAAASARPKATSPCGYVLGSRYLVTRPLASGGMGRVFQGIDQRLHRDVAIKLLRDELVPDDRLLERFRREALSAAALAHPTIASIFDYGEHEGIPYIVMELVRGRDLAAVMAQDGPLVPPRAARIAEGVLEALQHAHDAGVVHRDVKPANVMLWGPDRVKVTDFGIAQAAGASRLTATGILLGSAHYISPEQVEGRQSTPQSDIYATGVLLFEMLVGRPPFDRGSPLQIAKRHLAGGIPPPSRLDPTIPRAFDTIVARATALEPERRFASAADMARLIRDVPDVRSARDAGRSRTTTLRLRERYDTPPLSL